MARTDERGGPHTRARILEVANRMFMERGYDAVTVAEVAKEAGVSSVTVFNHFPKKEDLFLDRAGDAAEFIRSAVRYHSPEADVLDSLHDTTMKLFDARHPLSGVSELAVPFLRTVAGSTALVAKAREITSDLQGILVEELDADETFAGDAKLLAAFFFAGYSSVFIGTATRLMAGEPFEALLEPHRARLETLFVALREGVPLR